MPFVRRTGIPRTSGKLLLAAFLVATLVLSAWLGFHAVDSARSHRRTAEAVLRDYAGIAASEFQRTVQDELDDFLDVVFDDVPRQSRGAGLGGAEILAREMDDALRDVHCRCRKILEETAYFRLDARGGGDAWPDTVPRERLSDLRRLLAPDGWIEPDRTSGLIAITSGALGPGEWVVAYRATLDQAGGSVAALYAIVTKRDAFVELFERWYDREALLPAAIVGELPNDSVVSVTVQAPDGAPVFASRHQYPDMFSASDTLPAELGSLVVRASVRSDAAGHLIIGGLPRSRLPLLALLLLLTLGVGVAALVQVHREHQLDRLRDDFVSGVSHEFRTPLTQIMVFAELLEHDKLKSGEERQRALAVIDREARRLTHLVENVLRFARLKRVDASPPMSEPIDVGTVVREVLDAFEPLARPRSVRLAAEVGPDCRLRGNRTAVHQMLTNLLDNALKYGPEGQTVTVRARRLNGCVRLEVEDQGPGIPPSERRRIWAPYRRLDKDVAGDVRGSGIGLAVVADLAARQGGRAWVEDAPGTGGRFIVELDEAPLRDGEQA
jgi:signal transduction histidine kinase